MTEYGASRTLVKSAPELWAELSDQVSLSRHLAEPFGEIRITRLEPETAVAWEGERARGTVGIEPSGWGTRVTLTARAVGADPPEKMDPALPAPEAPRRGWRARLLGWFGRKQAPSPDEPPPAEREIDEDTRSTESAPPPAPASAAHTPGPPPAHAASAVDPDDVLVGVLDKLGAAHHRPFSRA